MADAGTSDAREVVDASILPLYRVPMKKKKSTLSPEALEQFREWGRQGSKIGASAGGKARAKALGRKGMAEAMAKARERLAEVREERKVK